MAIQELGIRSPLKEALFTKTDVRQLSKGLSLPTWDKPSFACLASRFPYGEEITPEGLRMVDEAEDFLFRLGFKQVRVRHYQNLARIEILQEEMGRLMEGALRGKVVNHLKAYRLQVCHIGSSGLSVWIDERGIMMKAIALLSGGLDSTLAAKIIMGQEIELEALNFLTVFCT